MKKSKVSLQTNKSYGYFSNLLFNIKSAKKWDPKLCYFQFLPVVPGVLASYLGILIPAELVRGLEEQWELQRIILHLFLLAAVMLICNIVQGRMNVYTYRNSETLTMYYEACCCEKVMDLDYNLLEEPEVATLRANAWRVLQNKYNIREAVRVVPAILSGLLGVVWYGLKVSQVSVVIVVLAILHTLLNLWMIRRLREKQEAIHKEIGKYAKQTSYINRQSMERKAGKDIRIYQMQSWFLKKYDEALAGMDDLYKKIHDGNFRKTLMDAWFLLLLNAFAYFYLIRLLVDEKIMISTFVLQIGLVGSFSGAMRSLINQVMSLNGICNSLNYIHSFLELEEQSDWSEGVWAERIAGIKQEGIRLDLKNIYFRYPNDTEYTLENINISVAPGERLALIGLNGAGKTTLVKLICGFFSPTQGEILLNDIPIKSFSREEYLELCTVLFQDPTLLPLTLDRNLTGQSPEQIDRQKLVWALELSGFKNKYESLSQKGETVLVREANSEAIDFSGGELQKMMFARALYKEAPIMILDEPTAALDPIAEDQMYQNFAKAAVEKTCIYISHRLSSTRFCDRILLLEQGKVVEEGTHEKLMELSGKYAHLYEVQSKYYKEQEARQNEETQTEQEALEKALEEHNEHNEHKEQRKEDTRE